MTELLLPQGNKSTVTLDVDGTVLKVYNDDGAITGFIDFEQAFVGTREMLAGILLHNPYWCARVVFSALCRRGFFARGADAIKLWIAFAFGAVLADSFARRGRYWPAARIESSYRRHVVERIAELMGHPP